MRVGGAKTRGARRKAKANRGLPLTGARGVVATLGAVVLFDVSNGCGARTSLELGTEPAGGPDRDGAPRLDATTGQSDAPFGKAPDATSDLDALDASPDATADAANDAATEAEAGCATVCSVGQIGCFLGAIATCALGANGCAAWSASMTCDAGLACVPGAEPSCGVLEPPRPIAPLSTSTVTSQEPSFRWALAAGADGAEVEIFGDRGCTHEITSFVAQGTQGTLESPLSAGVYYWRLRGTAGTVTGSPSSTVWEFIVGARSARVSTSWGTTLDVNGDGFADVAVGAWEAIPLKDEGAAYIYMGSPTGLAPTPTVLIDSAPYFGRVLASAGDVNGDGFADLIMGASLAGGNTGLAFVYPGGPTGLSTTPTTIASPKGAYEFGSWVTSAGDVNGDGFGDVLISAVTEADDGLLYVYFGSPAGLSATPTLFTSPRGGVFAAFEASDINGDGFTDVVVGNISVGQDIGAVYVYLGGPNGLSTTPTLLNNPGPPGYFGSFVANAGDVNGDGFADVVIGADGVNQDAGAAYLYFGSAAGLSTTPTVLGPPPGAPQFFGVSAARAGDVNGDGFGDIVIGASGGGSAGAAYVYLGGSNGISTTPIPLSGPNGSLGLFGDSVAGAGDVNGDGFGDVVIGADEADIAGAVDLFWGSRGGLSTVPMTVDSPVDAGYYGIIVAGGG